MLRLSPAAAGVVARWRDHNGSVSTRERPLAEQLHAAGLGVHRSAGTWGPGDVTVVVPAHERPDDLARCLRALLPPGETATVRVVVVDDASPGPAVREVADRAGAAYVRLPVNRGPAAARNAGLRRVASALVAFVDSDVVVPAGWLRPLLDALTDGVDVVAPRVVGSGGASLLARHERGGGPLDLGALAGPVLPGARVGHVPAAALLCRVAALGPGFDEAMRVGEDVDLVWRLAGHVRYEPDVVVTHATREGVAAWLRQRHGYGLSAAALDDRHPGLVAPVVLGRTAAPVLAAAATRRPALVLLALVATAADLHRRLPAGPGRAHEAARLAVEVPARSALQLAEGAARTWLPVLLPASLVSRRARRATALAVGVRLVRTRVRWGAGPFVGMALQVAEDLAYATGVWRGALVHRRSGAVLPRVTAAQRRGP